MPSSPNSMLSIYDVPELTFPNKKTLKKVNSYVNSVVKGLMTHKNIPTQNPIHIAHLKK